jgi:hypothetical protein
VTAVLLIVTIGVGVAVLIVGQQTARGPQDPASAITDLETIEITSADHVQQPVDYPRTPPAGGPHAPAWQNCGFYADPVLSETAVHSMEHGAVWLTYEPQLPQSQIDELRELAEQQTYILASPFDGLASPVVASAWGRQVGLTGADDPDLDRFVRAFRQGPQTPEPGAACTGAIDEPAP